MNNQLSKQAPRLRDASLAARENKTSFIFKLALASCLLVFWALCETALASDHPPQDSLPPNLELRVDTGEENTEKLVIAEPLSLETDVSITVNGPIVRTTVTQSFENPSEDWVEGLYTFPLPENAAVDQLKMLVGDYVIEGQIKEKREAQQIYTAAKKEGKRAALLEKPKGNLFTTHIANIAPGAHVKVVFSYQHTLAFKDHGYSLRVPVVATPQYDPEVARGRPSVIPKENQIQYRDANEYDANPVSFTVSLGAGMPVERLWSGSHKLAVDKQGDASYAVQAGGAASAANQDFVLNWIYAPQAYGQVSMFSEKVNGDVFNMLMLMPPAPSATIDSQARELVFVLDVSGSMSGPSIRQAKEAIRSALLQLNKDDRFNIIFFNDTAWSLFARSSQATSKNLLKARYALEQLDADKGTEMSKALHLALKNHDDSLLRQVVFITDGAVSNEDQLLSQIKRNLGSSRLFTVGIGSAPNSYFMRRAAEMGRGTFSYISDLSQVHEKMQSLFNKLNHPALTDIRVALDVEMRELTPDPVPDLYMNEATYLFFKTTSLPEELHIEAQHGNDPAYLQQRIGQTGKVKGVAVEWARQKIKSLTNEIIHSTSHNRDALKQQVTALALEHHQVSKYTSLIAVDVTPVRTSTELRREHLKSNLPKGWQKAQPEKQAYQLAQTATSAPWFTQAGFLWLCVALSLWLITLVRRARNGIFEAGSAL